MSADVATVSFTRRERQVVQGLADGLTDHEIASRLRLSLATVRRYMTTAKRKVGVTERVALVDRSYGLGLIRSPACEPDTVYLTPQHRELLSLVVKGLSKTQIAVDMRRPPSHVRRATLQLMKALGARTRTHVVTRARQYGLLKTAPRTATGPVGT